MSLRKSLIRLAHDHPELRSDLLPLLRQDRTAASEYSATGVALMKVHVVGARLVTASKNLTTGRPVETFDVTVTAEVLVGGTPIRTQSGTVTVVFSFPRRDVPVVNAYLKDALFAEDGANSLFAKVISENPGRIYADAMRLAR